MTKKDYAMVAKVIRDRPTIPIVGGVCIGKGSLVDALCLALKKDNPKFDEERFKETCYEDSAKCGRRSEMARARRDRGGGI